MQDIIIDTLSDGIKLLPFLFVTYLIMEYIEHKTSRKARQVMKRSGKWGPVIGGILGIVPQCGFSTAASNLYAGRIITLGTLSAVFLSTSDEMLPILISQKAPANTIFRILLVKAAAGVLAGLVIDFMIQVKKGMEQEELRIEHMCDHQHCHCGEGKIVKSAVSHTLQIFVFIILISFLLNLLIGYVGEDMLAAFISEKSVLGPVVAGLIGLIPNCASSVVLTQLYLEGVLGAGSMIAGLLAGSGVGLLVLYRVNDNLKENIRITLMLYGIGVVMGILIEMTGFVF
ncbi:MAG: arsenic efflux protein [Lachnospiraceae bacterium]|nr:arsenic efflux protein [Lachnospiraceae bacterium]